MQTKNAGYEEIAHTADWALRVWAADLPGLLWQAAAGMYALMDARLATAPRVQRCLQLEAADAEGLLVTFLGELLYLNESEGLGFDQFQLEIGDGFCLFAVVEGAALTDLQKEIKAVTYHALAVQATADGLTATIVFDV